MRPRVCRGVASARRATTVRLTMASRKRLRAPLFKHSARQPLQCWPPNPLFRRRPALLLADTAPEQLSAALLHRSLSCSTILPRLRRLPRLARFVAASRPHVVLFFFCCL